MAGANMSGVLRRPELAIPRGELSAIAASMSTYALVIFALGCSVRARPGSFSALRVSHSISVFYGAFVWVHRALSSQKWRFPARAGRP